MMEGVMAVHSSEKKRNLQTILLGRLLGIPIGVHYSWFAILVLFTCALAAGYFPAEFPGWPALTYWILGALTTILLFAAVLLHELGHAAVALHYQVPVRGITLFLFGGIAQLDEEPPGPAAEFWIAIAGPLVSLALAAALGLLRAIVPGVSPWLALIEYLAFVNATLALFNLIPGFPLDGGRVFRAIVWAVTHNLRRASVVAANLGRGVALLFVVAGMWQVIGGNMATGLWIAFVGWFLEMAARAEVRRQQTQGLLAGHSASEVMEPDHAAVPPGTTLQQLVDRYILVTGARSFVIEGDDRAAGLLTLHQIKGVPRSEWPTTPVARIMTPAARVKSVRPDSELWTALQQMDREGVMQLPVMANGQILGMLTREGIARFQRTLRELGA
jgi:Zn-dependent protease